MTMNSFVLLPEKEGPLESQTNKHHVVIWRYGWRQHHNTLEISDMNIGAALGFLFEGYASITRKIGEQTIETTLCAGMYFCLTGLEDCIAIAGKCILIHREGFQGLFMAGGPVEEKGRLKYIDGATDTLIIPPTSIGDPCLTFINFPPHIRQTLHAHPSLRICWVFRGRGRCILPENREILLVPGMVFAILANGEHAFFTDDESLDVITYHFDTDFGPDDHGWNGRS